MSGKLTSMRHRKHSNAGAPAAEFVQKGLLEFIKKMKAANLVVTALPWLTKFYHIWLEARNGNRSGFGCF